MSYVNMLLRHKNVTEHLQHHARSGDAQTSQTSHASRTQKSSMLFILSPFLSVTLSMTKFANATTPSTCWTRETVLVFLDRKK